jgi:diadenosine tetraphosphate (Ap4A) HIT family hydrolase
VAVTGCRSCELVARRDRGEAPAWDRIHRTPSWDLAHAYDAAVEGWLVLVARRHIEALAEMTDAEAAELGPLLRAVSTALGDELGCVKTYVAQFAEHPAHRHVHVHLVPRFADQAADRIGPRIFDQLGGPEDRWVGEERMNEIASAIGRRLATGDA